MAALFSFEELRAMSEVALSEWSALSVKDEPLASSGPEGQTFWSIWDNWLLPDHPNGIEPIISNNGYILDPESQYTIVQAGSGVRGRVDLTTPMGPDAIVLATFRRSMFSDTFWANNLRLALADISNRLLLSYVPNPELKLNEETDPWHLVVMQSSKNALINLQTILAGFGRSKLDTVEMDFSRAANHIGDVVKTLREDIDRGVIAWRWRKHPPPRASSYAWKVPGPGPTWGLF